MPNSLTREQRSLLSRVTLDARDAAEIAARAALENLAVHEKEFRAHMNVDRQLCVDHPQKTRPPPRPLVLLRLPRIQHGGAPHRPEA